MLPDDIDYEGVLRVTLKAAEKVISETFIIAGVILALSIITVIMLKYSNRKEA
jgi:cell division protein FtsL